MTAEVFIPLGRGKYAVMDLMDWEKIQGYSWSAYRSKSGVEYARGFKQVAGKRDDPALHQVLLGDPPSGFTIGHLDGDGLNCRRKNIKFLTFQQNAQGPRRKGAGASSKFRGVSWNKNSKNWRASIYIEKRVMHLGSFSGEIKAALAYDTAARKYFGEHAAPNFP